VACAVRDSIPGVPYTAFGATNEDVIRVLGDDLLMALYERLVLLARTEPEAFLATIEKLIRAGLVDPVRLFVKQEPHKMKKVRLNRWRLICAVSIIDSLVERCLWQKCAKEEIKNWKTIPSKPGMGATDEMISFLADNMNEMLLKGGLLDTDVEAWDWQRKWWLSFSTVLTFVIQADLVAGEYLNASFAREIVACDPMMSFSDGLMTGVSDCFGLMLSGRFVTSCFNSKGRVNLHTAVGTRGIAMGDDSQEGADREASIRVMASLGNLGWRDRVESSWSQSLEGAIFCSLKFRRSENSWIASPVRWQKMLYLLLSKRNVSPQEVMQFEREVRHLQVDIIEPIRRWFVQKMRSADGGSVEIVA